MKRTIYRAWMLLALASAASAESLSIKGSNTFGEELGPRLIARFQSARPDWKISLESRNSGYGIRALLDGACDIAAASRTLNEDESRMARSRRISLRTHAIGYYGIAVIVHPDNPCRNLSSRQVRDIFSGAATQWSDVGGGDKPMTVHISTPEAGTYLGFQELALDRLPYRSDAIPHETYVEIIRAVAADPQAIGYAAVALVSQAPVRALSINGVPATPIAVSDNLYPYARMLRFYTDKGRTSKAAAEFIQFVRSTEGQNIVEESGFIRRFQGLFSFGSETP